jgi:protein O-GlcNAc transferase
MPHLQEALEIDPNNPETQNNLGSAFLQMGRVDEAMPFLQKALELEPNRAAAIHYNFGCALLLKGRTVEAIPYLQRALEIDPTYLPAEAKLGNALFKWAA